MSFSRAVVIGTNGQVAKSLAESLKGREVIFTSSKGGDHVLDLGNPDSIHDAFGRIYKKFGKGDVEVFVCGAMTHVDRCEQEKDLCFQVNAEGPSLVARHSHSLKYGLTYFSTEYVFGGAEYEGGPVGPFSEEDAPNPCSWYGRCKLEAEQAVQDIFGAEGALIARTTMVFSWDPKGMNFLMQYVRHLEKGSIPFRVPMDQISTPTYGPWLADAVVRLRDQGRGGIYNLVGADLLSRKDLVERVATFFGYGPERVAKEFQFVKTAELGQAAQRPLTAGLKSDKAQAAGLKILSLEESLAAAKAVLKA